MKAWYHTMPHININGTAQGEAQLRIACTPSWRVILIGDFLQERKSYLFIQESVYVLATTTLLRGCLVAT